jgi:hypothetical protein
VSGYAISLDQVGCEARKIPAEGVVFFLDFSLYRTNREFESLKPFFKASDFIVQLGESARQGNLIKEKDNPDCNPCCEEILKVLHTRSQAMRDCLFKSRDSIAEVNKLTSYRKRSRR